MNTLGLSEKRYIQMLKSYGFNKDSHEAIEEIIDMWGVENCEKGYDVFDFDGTGMLEIEAIADVDAFESDEAAVEEAIADGVKIIPVYELPENFDRRYLGWIDTPENRKAIEEYCKSDNYYCNGNSLK